MKATTFQTSSSLSIGQDGIAVPGTPFLIARNSFAACAVSDHGGNVRFAGGGFIASRRDTA